MQLAVPDGLAGSEQAFGLLETQKQKYHVLAQLQPLAVSLASGDTSQTARACLVVANLVGKVETREPMLSHPVYEVLILRIMSLVQHDDWRVAAAALKALKEVSADSESRRRVMYPRQSSLLGPRSPVEVVRCMLSGVAVLLNAPDPAVCADAAATTRNLMCSPGIWERLGQLSDQMLADVVLGLQRAMLLQGVDRNYLSAALGAGEALNAICGQVEVRERLIGMEKFYERLLEVLTAALADRERGGDAAAVLCSLLGGEETNAFQASKAQTAMLTRHPSLAAMLVGMVMLVRDAPEPHAVINAHRCCHLIICNEDLPGALSRVAPEHASEILVTISKMLIEEDPQVAADTSVALERVAKACYGMIVHQPEQFQRNLIVGWRQQLQQGGTSAARAAVQGLSALLEGEEGQALLVMWPCTPELAALLGCLVARCSETNGEEVVAAQCLTRIFRGTQGETLLRRLLEPPEIEMQRAKAKAGVVGWLTDMIGFGDPLALDTSSLQQSLALLQAVVGAMAALTHHQDLEACGAAVEVLCCWGAVDQAWALLMSHPDSSVVMKLVTGATALVGRTVPPVVARNAIIVLHCFSVEERGRTFLRSQHLQNIRGMLGGLLLHTQSTVTTDELTAQIANGCLRNLRDSGEECWPRWINGLTLPREYLMGAAAPAAA